MPAALISIVRRQLFAIVVVVIGACAQAPIDSNALEQRYAALGLVNVASVDSTIRVDLRYSTADNFLGADVYGGLCACWLQRDVAAMLKRAQALLQADRPGWSLVALDCARPVTIQREMWRRVKGTPQQRYVAEPGSGSVHNYGCAIDLTIVDNHGDQIDMGTPFDFFGDQAQPRFEAKFLADSTLLPRQIANRNVLRRVMKAAGFRGIMREWWHFEALTRAQAAQRYPHIN
jgi:D-alanyl-D-alanine dipeptidase